MHKYLVLILALNYASSQSNEKLQHGVNAHRVFISPTHRANGYANSDGHNRRIFQQQIVINRSLPLQFRTSTSGYETPRTPREENVTRSDGMINQLGQQFQKNHYENEPKEHESTSSPSNNHQINYGASSNINFRVSNGNDHNNANEYNNLEPVRNKFAPQPMFSAMKNDSKQINNNQQTSNGDLLPINWDEEQRFDDDHYQHSTSGYFSHPTGERFPPRQSFYRDIPYDKDVIAESEEDEVHSRYNSDHYRYDDDGDRAQIDSELIHPSRYGKEIPALFPPSFYKYPNEYYPETEGSETESQEFEFQWRQQQQHEDAPFYPRIYWTTDDDYYQ